MCFSVDYAFVGAAPDPSSQYVWVIERAKGDPYMQPKQLVRKGTLEMIIVGWRPENGPFSTYLMETAQGGTQRKVSRPLSLR